MLHPGEFVLGSHARAGRASPTISSAAFEGKSSLGRLGLLIHSTAGFVDAGWDGHITLELSNVASLPITLYPGMKIGQVSFMRMTTPADRPYGSGARRARSTRASVARRRAATWRTSARSRRSSGPSASNVPNRHRRRQRRDRSLTRSTPAVAPRSTARSSGALIGASGERARRPRSRRAGGSRCRRP